MIKSKLCFSLIKDPNKIQDKVVVLKCQKVVIIERWKCPWHRAPRKRCCPTMVVLPLTLNQRKLDATLKNV